MLRNKNSIQLSGSSTSSNELLISHSTELAPSSTSTAPYLGKTPGRVSCWPYSGHRNLFMTSLAILSFIVM